jgi:hypothetical protein
MNMRKTLFVLLILAVALFGCTGNQPQPTANPTQAVKTPFSKADMGTYTIEVPTDWQKFGGEGISDAIYFNKDVKTAMAFANLDLEGASLFDFSKAQMIDIYSKYEKMTEMDVGIENNFDINKYSGRDWFVACYSYKEEDGSEGEACQALTTCGTKAGVISFSTQTGKLQTEAANFKHSLETYKC